MTQAIEGLLDNVILKQVELEPVVIVGPQDPIRLAIEQMREKDVAAAIISENDLPLGMLTKRDVLHCVALQAVDLEAPVNTLMSPNPPSLTMNCNLRLTIETLTRVHRRNLPIVDQQGKVTGLVTVRALIHFIAEQFPTVVFNLPPNPDRNHENAEGA